MIKVNDNFCKLPAAYLFSEVAVASMLTVRHIQKPT